MADGAQLLTASTPSSNANCLRSTWTFALLRRIGQTLIVDRGIQHKPTGAGILHRIGDRPHFLGLQPPYTNVRSSLLAPQRVEWIGQPVVAGPLLHGIAPTRVFLNPHLAKAPIRQARGAFRLRSGPCLRLPIIVA